MIGKIIALDDLASRSGTSKMCCAEAGGVI